MRIVGNWVLCDDGVSRPIVLAHAMADDGSLQVDRFLVDSGADRTVFSASLFSKLCLAPTSTIPDFALTGVGGFRSFVLLDTALEFAADDGNPARVRGQFASFTDPAATDMSILGRDVLNNFDVIISRPRTEILMLAGKHRYVVDGV